MSVEVGMMELVVAKEEGLARATATLVSPVSITPSQEHTPPCGLLEELGRHGRTVGRALVGIDDVKSKAMGEEGDGGGFALTKGEAKRGPRLIGQ